MYAFIPCADCFCCYYVCHVLLIMYALCFNWFRLLCVVCWLIFVRRSVFTYDLSEFHCIFHVFLKYCLRLVVFVCSCFFVCVCLCRIVSMCFFCDVLLFVVGLCLICVVCVCLLLRLSVMCFLSLFAVFVICCFFVLYSFV